MGIRVVPNETVPATVYKHLLPHERQVITVRFHPAVLIRPVAEVLAGLAIAACSPLRSPGITASRCSSSG